MPIVDHLVHGERSTYTVVVGEQESTWRGKGLSMVLTKTSLNVDWGLLLPFAVLKMIHNFILLSVLQRMVGFLLTGKWSGQVLAAQDLSR